LYTGHWTDRPGPVQTTPRFCRTLLIMSVILASLAALFFGTADFIGGFASRKNSIPAVLVWSQLAGLGLVLVFILIDPQLYRLTVRDGFFGGAAGIAGLGGLVFLYRGLARGLVGIVSPLAALIGAVTPLAAGLILGEQLPVTAGIGIALSLPAIVLVSWHGHIPVHERDPQKTNESIRDGVLAGLFFGLFFTLISVPAAESGMWPLAIARMSSISVMVLAVRTGKSTRFLIPGKNIGLLRIQEGIPVVVATGLLDMAANIFLVLSFRYGLLTIAAVISSAYPAQTVVLSRIVFGERVGVIRLAGIVLALTGIALMAV